MLFKDNSGNVRLFQDSHVRPGYFRLCQVLSCVRSGQVNAS
jgi:hypothetical protein